MIQTTLEPCAECGMHCEKGEYHPYAACLMFRGCKDAKTVRSNLAAVRNTRPQVTNRDALEALKALDETDNWSEWVCEFEETIRQALTQSPVDPRHIEVMKMMRDTLKAVETRTTPEMQIMVQKALAACDEVLGGE